MVDNVGAARASGAGREPVEEVDLLVVGSGPSGATYARVVADEAPQARILLVDAGPVVSHPAARHVNTIADAARREAAQRATQGPARYGYGLGAAEQRQLGHVAEDGRPLAHPGLFLADTGAEFPAGSMATAVGGMGIHWFGACPRPGGSERIDFIEQVVLDGAYDHAEELLQVGPSGDADDEVAVHLRTVLSALFDEGRKADRQVQPLPMALERGPDGPVQAGPGTTLGALVGGGRSTFELRPETLCQRVLVEGARVSGAVLEDRRSGRTTMVRARAVVLAADSIRTPQLLVASGLGGRAVGHYLNEHSYLSTTLQVAGDAGMPVGPRLDNVPPPSGVTWVPFADEAFPFHLQLTQRARRIDMGLFLPKTREFDNAVEFRADEVDFYGMPAPRVRYRLSERDLALIDRATAVPRAVADALGATVVAGPTVLPPGSSLHYQGTIRMGPSDDGTSVCDVHSRVWGTENLYVAGNGVIPTSTACNPTLTSVALAVLGARALARQLHT